VVFTARLHYLPERGRPGSELEGETLQVTGTINLLEAIFLAEGRAEQFALAGPAFGFRVAAGQEQIFTVGAFFGGEQQDRAGFSDAGEVKEIGTLTEAIAILFARDNAERDRCRGEHAELVARCPGVELLSALDLDATPPFDQAHDHFGYRDRLSQPCIEGAGEVPTPGSGPALKAGEFILGYPDEEGPQPPLPQPDVLSRNGSYMAYRRLEEHVDRFRAFLRSQGETRDEQELAAAKLMGRWRSGAPLALAPDRDDAALGADLQRNNDFNFKEMDPHGYAVPIGSHIRRMNPRDTGANLNRRRMIRRGATYGPPLPEGAPDDGRERGIAAFVLCASLVRQFEFAQNVWINDRDFQELGNERDPIIGTQDGTLDFTIPRRPIRRKVTGLPAFTTLRGGAYFFLPGLTALRHLASLGPTR